MRTRSLAIGAAILLLSGCAYHSPTSPTPPATTTTTTVGPAASVSVSAFATGGATTVTAHVRDAGGRGVPDAAITFTTSAGVLDPATMASDRSGDATTLLFSNVKTTVSATVGDLHADPVDVNGTSRFRVVLSAGSTVTRGTAYRGTLIATALTPEVKFTSASINYGDGASAAIALSATGSGPIDHTYTQAGTFTVTGSVTDSLGITEKADATVTVSNPPAPPPPPPPPSPSYTVSLAAAPSTVVAGDSSTLTATVAAANGAPAATSFDWDCNGDGTVDATTTTNFTVCTYNTAGAITSRVTARSASVSGSGSTTVTVTAAAPLFVAIAASNSLPAAGATVTFTATVTSSRAIPAVLDFYWDEQNDGSVEHANFGSASPNSQDIVVGAAGTQTVKVRVVDPATGREATSTRTVTVH